MVEQFPGDFVNRFPVDFQEEKLFQYISKTWTGLSVEESIRMTEDRDKWRKYVRGVANPRIEDG